MDQNEETKLTQMKNSLQKLASSPEKYGDPTLKRFLIARSMDPHKAAMMFVQWQKWRDSFVPLDSIPDSEVPDELEARKIYLQGLSKEGHPVLFVKASKHFPSKDQPQFKKFVVHLLDKTIRSSFKGREIGDEKLVAVLDLKQISYKNIDARGFITGFQFLQAYYPELSKTLHTKYAMVFFEYLEDDFSLLEKATLEKIVIISNEDEKREAVREIGEEALPEECGGKAKLVALQDVLLSSLED